MKTIITIGRQYGSGGRAIGRRVAEVLGIPCYDKELILLAAQKSGMSAEAFAHVDETATNSFLYAISAGGYPNAGYMPQGQLPLNDKLFITQTDVIREAAKEGSAVFIGRCADFVLKDEPHLLNVFVRADTDFRIARIMEAESCGEKAAADIIAKADKKRAKYYNFYTHKRWGSIDSYDLVLNNAKLGSDEIVSLICAAARTIDAK